MLYNHFPVGEWNDSILSFLIFILIYVSFRSILNGTATIVTYFLVISVISDAMQGEEGGSNIRLRIHLLHSISVVFMILVLAHKSEKD